MYVMNWDTMISHILSMTSRSSLHLLRQLKERKLETVLLDGNENCLARNIADKFYKVNIFNIEDVKKIAIDEKVDFIITVCADQVLLVVAQVSEMLGFPRITP